jgi:parallel beta-helix repeat protein
VLLDTDGNELRDNHLIANNGSGVSVRPSSAGNEVRNNTAERNDRFGVLLADSVDTALVDNTATGNAESGFFLSGDARTITDNAATENGQDGFLILSAGETLDGNAATDNARHGFRVQFRAENVTLHGGTAAGNEADGVSIRAAGSTVTGIDATGNDRDGIQVRFVDDTGIEGAVANDNGRHGVLLNGSVADTRLSDTTANGNDRTGFALSGSAGRAPANTSLSDNVARNNEVWAIAIRNASGTVVDELDIGASTEPGTTLSFGGENVAVGPAASPPASPDNESLGRYVEAESVGGGAFLDLELHYTDADASGIDESSLTIRRYDGSEWVAVDSTPDPAANVVAANVTDFSTFGGFGTAGGENESDDGEDGEEGDDSSTIVPGQPGFGVIVVGVALLLAGLLARRRA